MSDNKSSKGFWWVFAGLILLAAFATIGNLTEYNKTNRLHTEGIRTMAVADSVAAKGSKTFVRVLFSVNGKVFQSEKKVKAPIQKGDSIPVYYLPADPYSNAIAVE